MGPFEDAIIGVLARAFRLLAAAFVGVFWAIFAGLIVVSWRVNEQLEWLEESACNCPIDAKLDVNLAGVGGPLYGLLAPSVEDVPAIGGRKKVEPIDDIHGRQGHRMNVVGADNIRQSPSFNWSGMEGPGHA